MVENGNSNKEDGKGFKKVSKVNRFRNLKGKYIPDPFVNLISYDLHCQLTSMILGEDTRLLLLGSILIRYDLTLARGQMGTSELKGVFSTIYIAIRDLCTITPDFSPSLLLENESHVTGQLWQLKGTLDAPFCLLTNHKSTQSRFIFLSLIRDHHRNHIRRSTVLHPVHPVSCFSSHHRSHSDAVWSYYLSNIHVCDAPHWYNIAYIVTYTSVIMVTLPDFGILSHDLWIEVGINFQSSSTRSDL